MQEFRIKVVEGVFSEHMFGSGQVLAEVSRTEFAAAPLKRRVPDRVYNDLPRKIGNGFRLTPRSGRAEGASGLRLLVEWENGSELCNNCSQQTAQIQK